MKELKVRIEDTEKTYRWEKTDGVMVEIPHGEILKCLIYINNENITSAYGELIDRIKIEKRLDERVNTMLQNDSRDLDPRLLRLDQKWSSDTKEDKLNESSHDLEESYSLAESILSWRMEDETAAVVNDEELALLLEIITCDLYNRRTIYKEAYSYDGTIPEFANLSNYSLMFENLLVNGICSDSLKDFCENCRIEVGFTLKEGNDIFYITSLDQLVQLEIRNLLSKNKHNLTFCNCKECGRVFSRGGSGSAKIVRCGYPYKITCDERAGEKDDFGIYVETFYSKVRKYNQRNFKITKEAIDLTELARKRLEELSLKKIPSEEIKSQMEEWWKWVKKCCKEDNYKALK